MSKISDLLFRFGDLDSDSLLEHIITARIAGRVLNEINCDIGMKHLPIALIGKLTQGQEKIANKNKQQVEVIAGIQSAFGNTNKPMAIKGISAAALCNSASSIRYSGDIDVFFDDIPTLKKKLIEMGFQQLNGTPAPHEDSFFERDGVLVEVHKYFPILMEPIYPLEGFKLRKQLCIQDVEICRLEYSDLISHSTEVSNNVVNGLLVTNAPMTVFVLAAHLYKDLFWEPYKAPKIRLAEVLEIADLIELSDFNFSELDNIAIQFNAAHILNFAFSIIHAALHRDVPNGYKRIELPLIKLMNDSYSPYMISDETYFDSLPFDTFNQTVERLNCALCQIDQNYSSDDLEETYCASTSSTVHNFLFQVRRTQDKLEFRFNVEQKMADYDNFCVLLDKGIFIHLWLDRYPELIRVYGMSEYSIEKQESSYQVRVCLPIPTGSPCYAVLAMGKQDEMDKSVTVIPIRVIE